MGLLSHLLVVTSENAEDPASWSGTPFHLLHELRSQVSRVTLYQSSKPPRSLWHVFRRIVHGGTPPRYPLWMTPPALEQNAREVRSVIARAQPQAILSISSQCVARLTDPGRPLFLFSDAPWLAWQNAYAGMVTRPILAAKFAAEEAGAARRATGLFFSSEWAVDQAAQLYQGEDCAPNDISRKSHVVPMGANHVPPGSRAEVLNAAAQRPVDRMDLLFVGKDWERKGGPLAVAVTRTLRAAGVAAYLHVVGASPELPGDAGDFVTVHGFLSSSDPAQRERLQSLYLNSHFLLVPTSAECFGLVFAEAQAFALPPVSRAVHALPTVVESGITGLLLAPEASATEYRDAILAVWKPPGAYLKMATSARERFEQVLNWPTAVAQMVDVISRACA